jgi:Peptidase A4 family
MRSRLLRCFAVVAIIAGPTLAAAAAASSAALASVCQPNGTGCTQAGTYSGPDALINSNFSGFRIAWNSSTVQPYSSGLPVSWTVDITYTNIYSSSLTLGCTGNWVNASYVTESMTGGSGDDGMVSAETTTCSQNPSWTKTLSPGGSVEVSATFGNVPWPGSDVAIRWGGAGMSPSVSPFTTITLETTPIWTGYLAQTGNTPTEVNGTFVQPKVTCAVGESSEAGFWVGVSNSTGTSSIAQDGTAAFCYDGTPGYYLWWEALDRSTAQGGSYAVPVLNANEQGVSVAPAICQTSPKFTGTAPQTLQQLAFLVDNNCVTPIKPGDTIDLNVDVQPGSYASFFAYIPQTGFELNTSQAFSNAVAGGSEWIAEWPNQPGSNGLSNFGRVTFSNCYVYTGTIATPGEPINSFNDLQLSLTYSGIRGSRQTAASPGTLNPVTSFSNGAQDGFTVTWYSSPPT